MDKEEAKKIIMKAYEALRAKGVIVSDEYSDEPIIKTAANLQNFTPEKITGLMEMMNKRPFLSYSNARMFYGAAKFMEDFEDSYDKKIPFFKYFPTYRDMSAKQLRTYFTWRGKVRRKNVEEISLSYAYLYIYELINQIGVSSNEEGFLALKYFILDYSKFDRFVTKYYVKWLTEYAVYYGLPPAYLDNIYDSSAEKSVSILEKCGEYSDDELYTAVVSLSGYNPESSPFVRKNPDDYMRVVAAVFRSWSDFCSRHRKKTLCERLFGIKEEFSYTFFSDAVFFERKKHPDCCYKINDSYVFTCKDGKWKCLKYIGAVKKSKELGNVIREIDRIMREKYSFGRPITQRIDNKTVLGFINTEIDSLLAEKQKNVRREISIDISSLSSIRSDADITRSKLMTEEDKAEILSPEPVLQTTDEEDNVLLDSTEREFIALLLKDGDIKEFAAQKKIMLSVISENINEKLFDMFGDTVIEFDNDIPRLIEDYKEELSDL